MTDDTLKGFRLHRFEVLNWGTFASHVWGISPSGHNSLMTGDIGSGKSTLVDALTTLLVPKPSNQITFNKAAGALSQERTLTSYILGEYKKELNAHERLAKGVTLRDRRSCSVLLGVFCDYSKGTFVSLAQFFWFKQNEGSPDRFFVVCERELSIAQEFSGFKDAQELRAELRSKGCVVTDSLKEYAAHFSRLMNIKSEKALELFYQTVSMKSVGDLTQFVRDHMLEASDARSRVDDLCNSFDDLEKAHLAVVKAREQIAELSLIEQNAFKFRDKVNTLTEITSQRDLLEAWSEEKILALEASRESNLCLQIEKTSAQKLMLENERTDLSNQHAALMQAMLDNGGARIQELGREINSVEHDLTRTNETRKSFQSHLFKLAHPLPTTSDEFIEAQKTFKERLETIETDQREAQNRIVEHAVILRQHVTERKEIADEIASLKGRASNIPARLLTQRSTMAQALDLPDSALPFVGELIAVREKEHTWEGAIERVLHSFALSLLVDEQHYAQVSEWIDRTNLKGKLVYFKTGKPQNIPRREDLQSSSLVHKVEIKHESTHFDWLLDQLIARFDYHCAEHASDLKRFDRVVTMQGQIKHNRTRHEKDDRYAVHDRSQYVLGWKNQSKIDVLTTQLKKHEKEAQKLADSISTCEQTQANNNNLIKSLTVVIHVNSFSDIDTDSVAKKVELLKDELTLLETASTKLKDLKQKIEDIQLAIQANQKAFQNITDLLSKYRAQSEICIERQEKARAFLATILTPNKESLFAKIDDLYTQTFSDPPLIGDIEVRRRKLNDILNTSIWSATQSLSRLRDKLTTSMQVYRNRYPIETGEIDASIESLPYYEKMLSVLKDDDLPRFEQRFKIELNVKTIQSVVQFQSRLDHARRDIRRRIDEINLSLKGIDYNHDTYIQLQPEAVHDHEIKQFQEDLKQCLGGTLGGDLYDEDRFLKVRGLIIRFRGRDGSLEADKRWTALVTDVRRWFDFAASEIWRNQGTDNEGLPIVKEYYQGGGGKSGGQKEKLAYTILASALAYQFGTIRAETKGRSFRFVVIDEAFGKGSDESTRYGLELFNKLGLQLLIVTPLQKVRVIEEYVNGIHYIHNVIGNNSVIRNMSIEEYHEQRLLVEKKLVKDERQELVPQVSFHTDVFVEEINDQDQ